MLLSFWGSCTDYKILAMDLQCRIHLALGYKAGPQIARKVSEDWCARELYCPACDSNQLSVSKPNTPVFDFMCPRCEQIYQLKSSRNWGLRKIPDAGYETMVCAIRNDRVPNLLVLQYSVDWLVKNLLLVPRFFFTESIIERREPLGPGARRAGWVGCNILLNRVPADGRIVMIGAGSCVPKRQVREQFSKIRRLADLPPSSRGWTVDVLNVVRRLGKHRFTLSNVYEHEAELSSVHPTNRNIRAKIRQQLQILRDMSLIEFVRPGEYALKS